jgi:hypothetical protein
MTVGAVVLVSMFIGALAGFIIGVGVMVLSRG